MYSLSDSEINILIKKALKVRDNAYTPYSKFKVGAALMTEDGRIYEGCNVENSSYGATICAERTAFLSALASGERKFKAIAVVADLPEPCSPCGICRQFMSEFGLDLLVIRANLNGAYDINPLSVWLPGAFTPTMIKNL